ncbi:hypothetical protein JN01_0104 [Entomoplasma freundtii]|uniref:Uncharacterized protein n=1 Tax=Entomoplasma freundtii TaxID=74700 RepID=A0A2K8NS46_9MOLU|nr:MG406 family protein [Entomoplasma freundtii]ATZ16675.1 hypothetical protein EFREU_v1c06550 [Entomoplasma freundtii]TDY58158.1 hypothetical protein JN01_0104 [Entomoplasma freundtii]
MKKGITKLGHQPFKDKKRWLVYFVFCSISLISTLILGVLVGAKIIEWNWLTGQIIGSISAILAFNLANYSLKVLLKSENYYLYYFFYTLRLGLYVAPLLLALLIPSQPFYWVGVIIGLSPILVIPLFQTWLINKKYRPVHVKSKGGEKFD